MICKYTGGHTVLLMQGGKVWEVEPGDEMDLPSLPAGQWQAVKEPPQPPQPPQPPKPPPSPQQKGGTQ